MKLYLTILASTALLTTGTQAASAAQPREIPEKALAQLRDADRNGDGKVSRAELISYRTTQWSRLDRNGDNFISRDDLPGFAQDRWNSQRFVDLRRQFDHNGDDRISRAEFVNGPTPAFDMADANHDGFVSEAELRAAAAKARG